MEYKNVESEIKDAIEQIYRISQELGHPFHGEVSEAMCPHNPPAHLEEGQKAIYIFIDSRSMRFLKIGKVGPKSSPRFTSQHYCFSANSSVARSLFDDPDYAAEHLDQTNTKQWMLRNLIRVNVYFDAKTCDDFALSLAETYLHFRFRPKYEGKN